MQARFLVRPRRSAAALTFVLACALMPDDAAFAADAQPAQVQVCASCHGQAGTPQSPATPTIWGQQADYLKKQLTDYKNGDRDSQIMTSIAGGLSEHDIASIADYLAAAKWPAAASAIADANTAPAAIATCQACHQAALTGGPGPAGFAPRLAGQSAAYLASAMQAYASGERANNETMSALMKNLSAADMKSIAAYLSSLR
jgi:cytochrome c553